MGRLQTARLDGLIRRWGSIKGPGTMLGETLGDLFPVLSVEDLPPELLLLADIHLWSGQATVTGAAGENGGVQAVNPVNSGNIMVVESANIRLSDSSLITYGTINPILTTAVQLRNRDTRTPEAVSPWGQIRTSDTTNTEFFGTMQMVNNVDRILQLPRALAVLAPGTGFTINSTVNATTIRVAYSGYTRPAEPSELNF